ncbi:MAG TPA: hypothetical protein VGD56_20390, partial [Gemmatirosa sp.]
GLHDSVAVTVRPGAPARLHVAGPRDTAAYVGAQLPALTVDSLTDRWGNATSAPVTWASRRPDVAALSVGAGAARVQPLAAGRVWVVASAAGASAPGATDSVALSVVPHGELAARSAVDAASGFDGSLYRFGLDGSGYRRAAAASGNTTGVRWTPAGDRFVLHQNAPGSMTDQALYFVDTSGTRSSFATAAAGSSLLQAEPLANGGGVAAVLSNYYNSEIWQVSWSGQLVGRLGPAAGAYDRDLQPAVSADGQLIAIYSNRGHVAGTGSTLQLYEVAAARLTDLGIDAVHPRWSPDGQELAYVYNGLEVRDRATGARRHLSTLPVGGLALDWSPDGVWVVACVQGALALVHHTTGEVLPLAFTGRGGFCEMSWRPGS